MSPEPVKVYIGLGSNLGDRKANLERAADLLGQRLRIEKISPIYETEPVENVNQPLFLNQVCQVVTTLPPTALLTVTRGIEDRLGRPPKTHNLPRTIDVDILFYDGQMVNTPELVIPHPKLTERAFVLVPLADIAPDLVHPVNKKTVKELLAALGAVKGVVRLKG